jgi:hypothetical protein
MTKLNDLLGRAFSFCLGVLKLMREFPKDSEYNIFGINLGDMQLLLGQIMKNQ